MQDLRRLPIEDRRALAEDAQRRTELGETPAEICAALGLSITTYRRWAQLFGFRLSDVSPEDRRGRAQLPSGKRKSSPTGRFLLGEGFGARQPGSGRLSPLDPTAEGLETPGAVLDAVEAALDAGETRRADRLIAAWRRQQRRSRAIDALREAAIEAGERDRPIPFFDPVTGEGMMTMEWVKQASDEDLITYIKRKTGESD